MIADQPSSSPGDPPMTDETDMTRDGAFEDATSRGVCRCEATIAASVLDGYACGNPDCWRTAVAKASFDAFLADLIRRREREPGEPDAL